MCVVIFQIYSPMWITARERLLMVQVSGHIICIFRAWYDIDSTRCIYMDLKRVKKKCAIACHVYVT